MRDNTVIGLFVVAVLALFGWTVFSANQANRERNGIIPGIGGGPGNVTTTPAITDVRTDLELLLPEHGILASNHLQTIYDGGDTSATFQRLQNNSQQIAIVIETMGANRQEFLTMWNGHIQEYENYTRALKNNNEAGKTEAKEKLSMHAREMGTMINQLLPAISVDEGTKLMQDHINLTLSIIEAHAKGDTTAKLGQMTKASTQAVDFAHRLAEGYAQK